MLRVSLSVIMSAALLLGGCHQAPSPAAGAAAAGAVRASAGTIAMRQQIRARALREVRHWDRDGDELLTTAEAAAAGVDLAAFIARDRSEDGGLSATEWLPMDAQLAALRHLRELAYAVATAEAAGADQRYDAAEWRAAPVAWRATRYVDDPGVAIGEALFRAADHGADGLLGRDEVEAAVGRAFEAGWDPSAPGR